MVGCVLSVFVSVLQHCIHTALCGLCAAMQVQQLLEVGDKSQGMNKYTAMDKWANQLKSIHTTVCNKVV